jgi:hypothetical protein
MVELSTFFSLPYGVERERERESKFCSGGGSKLNVSEKPQEKDHVLYVLLYIGMKLTNKTSFHLLKVQLADFQAAIGSAHINSIFNISY